MPTFAQNQLIRARRVPFLNIVPLDFVLELCFGQTASTTAATVSRTSCLTQENSFQV
jgi:hypothetical protein